MENNSLICIVGPTAIGKTALSIYLAKAYNTEIISADSRQFYKEMQIGTAAPTASELKMAPHHFVKHISIFDTYSVGDFERDAIAKIEELFKTKDKVILVGGSGLYVKSILEGLDDFPEVSPSIREDLNLRFKENGIESLAQQLKELDPDYYKIVDVHNPHRVIRALEIILGSGNTYSSYLNKPKSKRNFNIIPIGLTAQREEIYDRINQRVDKMMDKGLLDEVLELYPHKDLNALNTVGYKELFEFIDKKISLEEAVEEIKKNTRRFAKRQLTWFRKSDDVTWFNYKIPQQDIVDFIDEEVK